MIKLGCGSLFLTFLCSLILTMIATCTAPQCCLFIKYANPDALSLALKVVLVAERDILVFAYMNWFFVALLLRNHLGLKTLALSPLRGQRVLDLVIDAAGFQARIRLIGPFACAHALEVHHVAAEFAQLAPLLRLPQLQQLQIDLGAMFWEYLRIIDVRIGVIILNNLIICIQNLNQRQVFFGFLLRRLKCP